MQAEVREDVIFDPPFYLDDRLCAVRAIYTPSCENTVFGGCLSVFIRDSLSGKEKCANSRIFIRDMDKLKGLEFEDILSNSGWLEDVFGHRPDKWSMEGFRARISF